MWRHAARDAPAGRGTPLEREFAQVYAAGDTEANKHVPRVPGRLPFREKRSLESFREAVRLGMVKPDIEPDVPGDLDLRPYLQLHHLAAVDTARAKLKHDISPGWAGPTRTDPQGEDGFVATCQIRREGGEGPEAVRRFQRAAGIVADNVLGPITLRTALERAARQLAA